MKRDPGNSLKKAKLLTLGSNGAKFADQVGGSDRADFFKININQRSSLNASLGKLKTNIKFKLFNTNGQIVGTSQKRGKSAQQLDTILEPGAYYIQIKAGKKTSPYRLKLLATPSPLSAPVPAPGPAPIPNRPPVLAANTAANLEPGATSTLSPNLLRATDPDNNPLTYTVTTLPQWGDLKLNNNAAAIGNTFTQADIDSGKVTYMHKGGIRQMAANTLEEYEPMIDGNMKVWTAYDGNDDEIFMSDGNTVTQLTDNTNDDYDPAISGKNIVWRGYDGNDNEIFFYNGSTTVQLTDNTTNDRSPQVSGNTIVWRGNDGNDNEIYFYNGTTTTQLTDNATNDYSPMISGNNVVWQRDGSTNTEIYFYNGSTTIKLNADGTDSYSPMISGNNVVWYSYDGTDNEIFLYNGTTTLQLTDNTTDESNPMISGNNVVWQSYDGTDNEIYFYNGSTTTQLTNNDTNDYDAVISGNYAAWVGESSNGSNNIFFYDGSQTKPVTNTYRQQYDLGISGANLVWTRYGGGSDGGTDGEIFFANLARQDMFGFTVSDGAGGSVAGSYSFAIAETPVVEEPAPPAP
jgi:beta propeller repeat protein